MTAIRRRVLRPVRSVVAHAQQRHHERWQRQLEADHQAFRRWMAKLKRAVTTLDRLQTRIGRLKRQLSA